MLFVNVSSSIEEDGAIMSRFSVLIVSGGKTLNSNLWLALSPKGTGRAFSDQTNLDKRAHIAALVGSDLLTLPWLRSELD